ncbi:MAG: hypothetical protein AB7V43_11455 [Acidimicrobiia bacterium]
MNPARHLRRPYLRDVALVVLLAACSDAADIGCTAIGCESSIIVDLHSYPRAATAVPATVHMCIKGDCEDFPFNDMVGYPSAKFGSGDLTVTIDIRDANGKALSSSGKLKTKRTRFAPNGEKCGPVCYSAGFAYDPATGTIKANTPAD